MADNFRVIQCPVGELEDQLNTLAEGFVPFVFAFTADVPSSSVTVICQRVVRQTVPMAVALPPNFRGPRQ